MKSLKTSSPIAARFHMAARVRLKTCILNPDGSVAEESPWQSNLILDAGLDKVASFVWAEQTRYCHIGTGTDPFNRDSGAITISVAGGVATASAGFFEAADVGRLLKLDTGEEGYITAFTSTTDVDVSMADAGASEGTVWYVNRTTLTTELKRTSTLRTSAGDNGTTYHTSPTRGFTHRRSYLFTAEVGSVTYREVGWSPDNIVNLFGGVVLSSPDNLVAGQQYLVISELILTPSPTASVPAPDIATGGWSSEGDISIETIGSFQTNSKNIFSSLSTTGTIFGSNPQAPMDPNWGQNPTIYAITSDFTLQTPSSTTGVISATLVAANSITPQAYAAGNFFRDVVGFWDVSAANTDWRGVSMGLSGTDRTLSVKFDGNQTKDNVHTVTATFRFSWGRVLVN